MGVKGTGRAVHRRPIGGSGQIKQVAFAPDGSWVILFDSNGYWHSELP
jgi:hypothetical protein